jgi:hypothetical protein
MEGRRTVSVVHIGRTKLDECFERLIGKRYGSMARISHSVWDGRMACGRADLVAVFIESREAVEQAFASLREAKGHSPDAVALIVWKDKVGDRHIASQAARLAEEFSGIFPYKDFADVKRVLENFVFNFSAYRIICDGCRDAGPRHHCSGTSALIGGVRIGRACQCVRCRSQEAVRACSRSAQRQRVSL